MRASLSAASSNASRNCKTRPVSIASWLVAPRCTKPAAAGSDFATSAVSSLTSGIAKLPASAADLASASCEYNLAWHCAAMATAEAEGATPARARARASAASKSSMRCNRFASEKISRIRSVVNNGSSSRIVRWSSRACRSIPRKTLHVQAETCGLEEFLAGGHLAESRHFLHRAIGLIDGRVGVRKGFSVGIRDGNAAKGLPPDDAGLLIFGPIRIEKRIVFVGVAMRPTIDGDRLNVARGIESGG